MGRFFNFIVIKNTAIWMFVSPQNSYVEIIISKVMVGLLGDD